MRKLMFFIVVAGGGFWYLKSNVNILSDDHTHTVGFALPTLGVGSASGVMSAVIAWLHGAPQPYGPEITNMPKSPGLAVSPTASAANPATVPPELLKYLNPSLLTTSPTGAQTLTPSGQQALQQIIAQALIAQARANPAAFREQVAKASQGAR